MKKILAALIALLLFSIPVFAEGTVNASEEDTAFSVDAENQDDGASEIDTSNLTKRELLFLQHNFLNVFTDFRLGATCEATFSICSGSDYLWHNVGFGVKAEAGLPLFLHYVLPNWLECFQNVGVALNIGYNYVPTKVDVIQSMTDLRIVASIYIRIPVYDTGLVLVPEAGYGVVFNFPVANPQYGNTLDPVYIDQVFMVAYSNRYSHPALLGGKLELGITPIVYVSPEVDHMVHFTGFIFSALYKF